MPTCDDVERIGGWRCEGGGGGNSQRRVADHWHTVTPGHHYYDYDDNHDNDDNHDGDFNDVDEYDDNDDEEHMK